MSGTHSSGSERVFLLPDLGEGLTEAEIVHWLVSEGDLVAIDQSVVEVETAKSVVEVPTPYAGRIATLHAAAGTTLEVGKPLITVADPSDSAAEAYRQEERAGSGNVLIGYGTSGDGASGGRRRRPREALGAGSRNRGRAPRVVSPLVRHLAEQHGIDLATVVPGDAGGIIRKADLQRVIAAEAVPTDADRSAARQSGERRVPLNGFRKAVSAALSRSRSEIPEATVWVDVDATALRRTRAPDCSPTSPGSWWLRCGSIRC
jgi:2-oxoisovalerate dehydrogenase E2 component (dihydrolipoyl transacylase)